MKQAAVSVNAVEELVKQKNQIINQNQQNPTQNQKTFTTTPEDFYLSECFQHLKDIKLEKK